MAEAARTVGICARMIAAAVRQEIAGRIWRRAVLTIVLGFDLEMAATSAAGRYGDSPHEMLNLY
jgi:hypothetical protein